MKNGRTCVPSQEQKEWNNLCTITVAEEISELLGSEGVGECYTIEKKIRDANHVKTTGKMLILLTDKLTAVQCSLSRKYCSLEKNKTKNSCSVLS